MPTGIILRNSTRAAHNSSDGRYAHSSQAMGVVGAGAAWWMLGGLVASKLGAIPLIAGTVGKWGAIAGAAILTSPVTIPAFTASLLASATIVGTVAAAASTIPAIANLPPAVMRTIDRLRGIKYTPEELKEIEIAFDRNSPSAKYERDQLTEVQYAVRNLSNDNRRTVYQSLKKEFDKATTVTEDTSKDAAPSAPAPAQPKGP
ncbi:MAG: hypothetical protein OXT65_11150 [Alphaproteobacteria bacterium]|nr:hypothetical protein [Alphaproteobacteria bacterium]